MTDPGVPHDDMLSFLWRSRMDIPQIGDEALDALLAQDRGPGETAAPLRPVADVLAALRAAPSHGELTGLDPVLAEFRGAGGMPDGFHRSRPRRPALASYPAQRQGRGGGGGRGTWRQRRRRVRRRAAGRSAEDRPQFDRRSGRERKTEPARNTPRRCPGRAGSRRSGGSRPVHRLFPRRGAWLCRPAGGGVISNSNLLYMVRSPSPLDFNSAVKFIRSLRSSSSR